jgi:Tol biopolymer transport system component
MRDAKTPNGSIWTAAADGSDAALLYDGNGECDEGAFWPVWSPDGKRLAMVC